MNKKTQDTPQPTDEKNELLEYHNELLNQCTVDADASDSLAERQFYSIASSLLAEAGVLDNVSDEDSFHHEHPQLGTKIDGWSWSPLEKTINGLIVKFNKDPSKIESINKSELQNLGKRVARVFEKVEEKGFLENLNFEDAARLGEMKECIDEAIKFRVIILTNHQRSSRVKGIEIDQIYDKETRIEAWDLSDLMELEYGGFESSHTLINFEELYGEGLKTLNASLNNSKHKSYLCVLPATYLSDLYHVYGQRLLQSNVRSFLEFRGLSNKGMRMTLLEEPENFFIYNNGITVTASSHQTKIVGKQLVITELENMQIVNGGQTTAVIYFAPKERGGPYSKEGTNALWSDIDLTKVSVQMKLTILEDLEEAPAMTANISQFSNTQAAVTKADLESNHPMHLRIEKISRRLSVTGEDGIPRKWFYERSRGQYTVQLRAKRTAAQKNNFTAQYPKKQKFVKTDMAKYENTWRLRPDKVSEGAQKNLQILGEELSKEWEQNENNFREPFYQDLIAKAILFRSVDKAINTAEWYKASRGYKAQAVTYTIAMLIHLLHKQNKEINLNRIYSNQKLSEAFLSQALDLARFVRDRLMDEEFRGDNANISQFAKKNIAWEKMQELDYDYLMIPDEDLLNTQQRKDQAYQTKALGKAGAYVDTSERILQVSQDEWAALIEYLKDNENFPFDDKRLDSVRKCIYYHQGKKVPSAHQAKAALEIREWAMGRDFSFTEG